jgi:hypothetical protein
MFLRMPVFPFFTGAASALTWMAFVGVSLLLTLGIFKYYIPIYATTFTQLDAEMLKKGESIFITILLFIYAYSMTAMMIRISFFRAKLPSEKTPLLIAVLLPVVAVGSLFLYVLVCTRQWDVDGIAGYPDHILAAANPFVMLRLLNDDGSDCTRQAFCALVWSILVSIWAIPWFFSQMWNFSPLEKK